VSAQTVWICLEAEGIGRLVRDEDGRRGTPTRLDPVKARSLPSWPAQGRMAYDHARLLLLLPPWSTSACPTWLQPPAIRAPEPCRRGNPSARCCCQPNAPARPACTTSTRSPTNPGLALAFGLTALPKATHLGSYSYRVRRESNQSLLAGLVTVLRCQDLATGSTGFNCDFHAIRHHGDPDLGAPLENHSVPKRSQRTRAVLTFFRPGPRQHRDGRSQRRHHPRPSRLARSSRSPTTGAPPPAPTRDYWYSTPS
jgi:hypothetical protein